MMLGKRYLLPQTGSGVWVMIGECHAFNGKWFYMGWGVGGVGSDGRLAGTDVCNLIWDRLSDLGDKKDIYAFEVKRPEHIERRLRELFDTAPSGSKIMLLCTPQTIDDLYQYLSLDPWPKDACHRRLN